MIDRQFPPDAPFQAELQCPEQPPEYADPHLCATTGLTVVGLAVLRTHALEPFNLASEQLQSSRDKRRQRCLSVALDDGLHMPHPGDVPILTSAAGSPVQNSLALSNKREPGPACTWGK